jgi:hypothetical protein
MARSWIAALALVLWPLAALAQPASEEDPAKILAPEEVAELVRQLFVPDADARR